MLLADGTRMQAQDWDAQARELVSKMTLEEKIEELHGIRDATHSRYVPPIPRLHIPALRIANGPAGVGPCAPKASHDSRDCLAAPISLASTWDGSLANRYGDHHRQRRPRTWARTCSRRRISILRVCRRMAARLRHSAKIRIWFPGWRVSQHSGHPKPGRNCQRQTLRREQPGSRRLSSMKLSVSGRCARFICRPSRRASRSDQVASLMGAYHKVNGAYCCENTALLDRILKKDWGFNGFVIRISGRFTARFLPRWLVWIWRCRLENTSDTNLEAAVRSGQVPTSVLDDKLIRRFRTMMQYGLFDRHPQTHEIHSRRKRMALRRGICAEEGMVLLKNDQGGIAA